MKDWADELALTIAEDLQAQIDISRLQLVAARLRILREQGAGEGIDRLAIRLSKSA